ncbi:phage tail protein [Enterococcus casseliflavus]|uniref:phage tail protein n=1 Tax=Enterococcus casseliflavus TaxID=37734 RepID=UPI0022DEBD59|nr:phage tail protein [Enterococcus casseliflavus]
MAFNVFEMFGTIDADNQKANDAIDETTGKAEKSTSMFSKIGGGLKVIGTGMAVAAGVAGAAAVGLSQKVISAYADYEQLVGGVDTLFGDASKKVQQFADEAFLTAGLSANEYMETVTGFSASLLQSLGGDTDKAADIANQAVTDMSDNANKMGSDIGSIQNAYQGFAKQNYTMLDNLKLGYGGTQEEMKRLLADAEKVSGIKYDISSFADVTEAIHVMQTEMGITGTTALEATETISGSIAGMSSAWENLLAGMGNADADVGKLVDNLVEQFGHVVKNITPVLATIVSALPPLLNGLLTAVADLLPTLLTAVTDLFNQVLQTLLTLLPGLIPVVVDTLLSLVQTIVDNLPLFIDVAMQIITALVTGIAQALPTLIPAAVQALITIVQGLINNLPMLLDAALQLIVGLAQGLLTALPMLIQSLPAIITALVSFLIGSIPLIIDAGIQLLISLVAELPTIITAIVEAIPFIITAVISALNDAIPQLIEAGVMLFIALVENLPQIIIAIVGAIPQIMVALIDGFLSYIGILAKTGVNLISSLKDAFFDIDWAEVGSNIIAGIGSGITNAASGLWNAAKGVFGGFKDNVLGFFGIHSPSRWGRDAVGKWIPRGIAGGIEEDAYTMQDALTDAANQLTFDTSSLGANVDLNQVKPTVTNQDELTDVVTGNDKGKSGDIFNITLQALGELTDLQLMGMAKKLVTFIKELKDREDAPKGGVLGGI